MLNADRTRLLIFEDFREDKDLPKFAEETAELRKTLGHFMKFRDPSDGSGTWGASDDIFHVTVPARSGLVLAQGRRKSVAAKILSVVLSVLFFWRKPRSEGTGDETMSIEEFFLNVKNSAEEIKVVRERAAGYERAMAQASRTGQKALLEKLKSGLNLHRMESQLVAIGLPKYVEESKVVEFAKASKRGLRLDWLRNFVRQIPENVVALKDGADELGIFDNYAVLHYDPDGKSVAKTEAERAAEEIAKRDPILFGFIKGSRRLYFVGDWIDEHCDLTLEQFADMMGAGSVESLAAGDPYRDPSDPS